MMQTPNPRYLLLLALLVATTTTVNAESDVPGCACQADTTCGTKSLNAEVLYPDSLFPGVLACSLARRRDPPYRFPDVLEEPVALCDGLEADPEFQRAVGNESIPYYINGDGDPYYETGFVAMKIAQGTCEDLIAEQNSCPVATNRSEQDEMIEFSSGNTYSKVEPKSCMSFGMTLPRTNSTLKVSYACESWHSPDKNITGGYEDGISIHAILGDEDLDLCGDDDDDKQAPSLTRADWIEHSSRRYMTKDIVDDGAEYCLLVVSIGNEPCRGPQPASSSSSHTKHGRLAWLSVGPLAVAFLSWVL